MGRIVLALTEDRGSSRRKVFLAESYWSPLQDTESFPSSYLGGYDGLSYSRQVCLVRQANVNSGLC